MMRTGIFKRVTDSSASPYITQKDVIMCRSGIQYYHSSELAGFITEDNKPPVAKEWYKEYRPANVVVRAKELCSNLPVTREHPDDFVNPDNFQELAGGITDKEVEVVALDGEAEGEIGLKTNLTFYTKSLYDYYKEHKEVSLGYTVKKHFVDNPEEVGYDILLDEITEVNHLAITKSGRGGSSVAVIDSIIGGMKPMRTGIWTWLRSLGKKQTDSKPSFGKEVFDALRSCRGSSEEEQSKELKKVFDSCAELKDCEQKTVMLDMLRDCYDNRGKAFEHEKELTEAFDSMYVTISGDSLKEIVDAVKGLGGSGAVVATADSEKKDCNDAKDEEKKTEDSDKEDEEKKTEDSDREAGKEDEEKKTEDSDAEADKEEKKTEDTDKEDEEKSEEKSDKLTKDSIVQLVRDSLKSDDALRAFIIQTVKDTLGIKSEKPKTEGAQLDSLEDVTVGLRDYSEFLC